LRPQKYYTTLAAFHHSTSDQMNVEDVDLCLFCSNLVKFREHRSNANQPVPHHPTPDLLMVSSSTCRLCRVIAIGWQKSPLSGKSTTLTGSTSDESTIITETSPWSVEVRILEARQMSSGAVWLHARVCFQPDEGHAILEVTLSFITCRTGGK